MNKRRDGAALALAFTLLTLNGGKVIDNSHFFTNKLSHLLSEPGKAVDVATWTNSRGYFNLRQTIVAPINPIVATDVSSGSVR
jgi:hypothetical protein